MNSANPREVIGSNHPPAPIDFVETSLQPLTLARGGDEKIAARVALLVKNANRWKEDVPEIGDAETANACEDFLAQLRLEFQAVDAERKTALAPIDKQRDDLHGAYKVALDLLTACGKALTPLKAAWLHKEDARIRREQDEKRKIAAEAQRRAEEAARAAAAKDAPVEAVVAADAAAAAAEAATEVSQEAASQKASVSGQYSQRASGLRSKWSCDVSDWPEAARALSSDSGVRLAIQKAADNLAKAQKAAMTVPWGKVKEEKVV